MGLKFGREAKSGPYVGYALLMAALAVFLVYGNSRGPSSFLALGWFLWSRATG